VLFLGKSASNILKYRKGMLKKKAVCSPENTLDIESLNDYYFSA